jgi:hypothetical protein
MKKLPWVIKPTFFPLENSKFKIKGLHVDIEPDSFRMNYIGIVAECKCCGMEQDFDIYEWIKQCEAK